MIRLFQGKVGSDDHRNLIVTSEEGAMSVLQHMTRGVDSGTGQDMPRRHDGQGVVLDRRRLGPNDDLLDGKAQEGGAGVLGDPACGK